MKLLLLSEVIAQVPARYAKYHREQSAVNAADAEDKTFAEEGIEDRAVSVNTQDGMTPDVQRRLEEMLALGPRLTPEAVDRITGEERWAQFACEECNQRTHVLVSLAEGTVLLCGMCLQRALQLTLPSE